MKKSKLLKIVSLVLGLSFILVACGQGGTNEPEKPATNGEGQVSETQYKDTITVAMTAQPPTLDASLTQSQVTFGVAGNIFEQLYTMNAEYIPTPELAESVEVSEDGLEYVFTLRQGVKFHNAKEMTADDVEIGRASCRERV